VSGRDDPVPARPGAPVARRRTAALRHRAGRVRQGVRAGGGRARAGLTRLVDRLVAMAPRIPVRDLATLRRQYPGLGPEELADTLVTGAANATAAVGAGVGAAAMLPVPLAMPTELAVELTGVAAIELKLIAELHEVYGVRPPGSPRARAAVYLSCWSRERGVDVTRPAAFNDMLGGPLRRELRRRVTKRMVRDLPSLTPFLVGATAGAVFNRRETRRLARRVRADLRKIQVPWDALDLPALQPPPDVLDMRDVTDVRRQLED
jgi:hypothetical protein